jgi:choline kinase
MKAIILAAGQGKRLKNVTDIPKCLLEIQGKKLIQRYLESLERASISEIVLVVGYKKRMVKETVNNIPFSGELKLIENPNYSKGSIFSLWQARRELNTDLILMDADVYFEDKLLQKIVNSTYENCLLIDTSSSNTGEEMLVYGEGNRIYMLGRGLNTDYDILGEWVGFIKIGQREVKYLVNIMNNQIRNKRYNIGYEDILSDLLRIVDFDYELVDGMKWVEIDFPEDLKRAKSL